MDEKNNIPERIENAVAEFKQVVLARKRNLKVKQPEGYSPDSETPYYKESYALDFKKYFDRLIAKPDKQLVISPDKLRISVSTLQGRFYQAKKYLIDHLDPTGIYKKHSRNIKISRTPISLVLSYQRVEIDETDCIECEARPGWKVQLEDFIDNSQPGTKFELERVYLSEEDVEYIRDVFVNMSEAFAVINLEVGYHKLKILRKL